MKKSGKLEVVKKEAATVLRQAQALEIKDNPTCERAGGMLNRIKELRAMIAEWIDPVIRKAHEAHLEAVKAKRQKEAPLIEIERIIKPKIAGYLKLQEEREAKQQAELQKKAARGVPVVLPQDGPKMENISKRSLWRFKIVDLNKIPRQYLVPDHRKIQQVVQALKDQTPIQGIEVYEETVVAAGVGR